MNSLKIQTLRSEVDYFYNKKITALVTIVTYIDN